MASAYVLPKPGVPADGAPDAQSGHLSLHGGYIVQGLGIWRADAELGVVWVYISYLRKRLGALGANVSITARRRGGIYTGGESMIRTLQKKFVITAMIAISGLAAGIVGSNQCGKYWDCRQ